MKLLDIGHGRIGTQLCWHAHRLPYPVTLPDGTTIEPCTAAGVYRLDPKHLPNSLNNPTPYLIRKRACEKHKLPGDVHVSKVKKYDL